MSFNSARTRSIPNYQIRVKGHLGSQWKSWFEGMTISLEENGNTLLSGPVTDQAALHGLIKKVRDLGMPLLLVNRVEAEAADEPEFKKQTINIVQQKENGNE